MDASHSQEPVVVYDFRDGMGPVPAHQHPNGGGWVSETVMVDATAYVSPQARVFGEAHVIGAASVIGTATVCGHAWVSGRAEVAGYATVTGHAHVSEDARIYGGAQVYGHAEITGHAHVSRLAAVSGSAYVAGTAHVSNKQVLMAGCFTSIPEGRSVVDPNLRDPDPRGGLEGRMTDMTDHEIEAAMAVRADEDAAITRASLVAERDAAQQEQIRRRKALEEVYKASSEVV